MTSPVAGGKTIQKGLKHLLEVGWKPTLQLCAIPPYKKIFLFPFTVICMLENTFLDGALH
jgi:hypothetical protein